jgi:esterase/lipase superfamily enzyme
MRIGPFWRRTGFAIVVALGLAGCAGPEGFLVSVPSDAHAPGATHEDMLVVTTRTRADSPAFLFAGGRAPQVAFADMIVSIPPDANRKIGEV